MTAIPRLRAILAIALLTLLGAATTASALTVSGSATDPADAGLPPGADLRGLEVAYDDAGTVTAAVGLDSNAGSSSDTAFVALGTQSGSTCSVNGSAALGLGARTDGSSPGWVSYASGSNEDGPNADDRTANITAARDGGRLVLTIQDPRIASRGYTCARAQTLPGPYDEIANLALAAPAAPVAPAGPAAPAATPTPAPAPQPTSAPTPPAAKAAKLRATLKGIPAKVKKGRRYRLRLTVANRGDAASKRITLRVRAGRGISVTPRKVKLKRLAPGKAKRVRLRVKVGRRARAASPLVVTAKAGARTAKARTTLRLKRAKAKPKPKPGPKPAADGLAGTFWWWNDYAFSKPFNIYSLRFYDNGYAYYRLPADGQSVPDRCDSVTAAPDGDGDYQAGCVKWDLKGTALTFSDPRFSGTYENGKLSIRDAEETYDVDKLAAPKPGERFNLSYQNIESTGVCGPFSYCSITKSYLTLQQDGQFGLQEESTSTLDTGGSFTYAGRFPPENRGTYEVLSGYRIKLSYEDGHTEIVPFGLVDGTSAVDSNVRLVLGRLAFWQPDEDD